MAHSPWMIPTKSDKAPTVARTTGKRAQTPSAGTQSSFAAMMAREQKGEQGAAPADKDTAAKQTAGKTAKSGSRQVRPVVARLPETGISLHNPILAGRTPSDLVRMQNFNKASSDISRLKALDGLASASSGATSLDMARNMNAAANLRTIAAGNNGKGFALTANDFVHTAPRTNRAAASRPSRRHSASNDSGIGKLSAKFESGSDGIAAIGYDSKGGTSYGKYQIASRVGSMKNFLDFLDSEAPDLSRRLRKAGPANTGSRRGAMPDVWREIAREQPERFEQLQESFILESHYKPALAAIGQSTGIDVSSLSTAMREVIWSTAVQHGPAGAARIFARADDISGKPQDVAYERKLITNVYNLRADQFGSSSSQVRNAVRSRFREEKQLALNLLDQPARANMA